jgi:hypothetical protein
MLPLILLYVLTALGLPFHDERSAGREVSGPSYNASDNCVPPLFESFQVQTFDTFALSLPSNEVTSPSTILYGLEFYLYAINSTVQSECRRVLLPADVAAGQQLADGRYLGICDDHTTMFTWNGTMLTVVLPWYCRGQLYVS